MAWIDYLIIGIIALSTLISLVRGFIKEALSLTVWILAFWVSWSFFREFAVYLQQWIEPEPIRLGAAFVGLMVTTLTLGALINFLVSFLVSSTGLSGTDRLIGVVFGAARGALLVAVLVLLAGLTPLPREPWWAGSALVPVFQDLALWLRGLLPGDIARNFSY